MMYRTSANRRLLTEYLVPEKEDPVKKNIILGDNSPTYN